MRSLCSSLRLQRGPAGLIRTVRVHTMSSMSSMASATSQTENLTQVQLNPLQLQELFPNEFLQVHDIISEEEESKIVAATNSFFRRKKYEGDHWDAVIALYKEVELSDSKLSDEVKVIFNRCKEAIDSFMGKDNRYLPLHAIDLAKDGHIAPHVDSVKFSGDFIASLSLLSDRVLVLSPALDPEHPLNTAEMPSYAVRVPRRSMYLITGRLRYDYTHAILGKAQIVSGAVTNCEDRDSSDINRRISIMFRDVHPNDRLIPK